MHRHASTGRPQADYEDIRYETAGDGIAKITIDRPEVRNAFRPADAHRDLATRSSVAREDTEVGVIILTGEGPRRVLLGRRPARARRHRLRRRAARRVGRFHVTDLHVQIRRLPKPVVAMVAGYAIGGGHVLHLVCDLTIAADNARFGQTGPKVGSFDGGFGAVAPGRAWSGRRRPRRSGSCAASTTRSRRSRWGSSTPSCRSTGSRRRPSQWCREMLALSPFALRLLKASFHAARGRLRRHPAARPRRQPPLLRHRGGRRRAARPTRPKRTPDFSRVPAAAVSAA